jgi:hypothetical protein
VFVKIAGQTRTTVKGISYPNSCKTARTPPIILNRFVEAQPAIKVKTALIVKKKRIKMRSPSKLKIEPSVLKGIHIIAVRGNVSRINGASLKEYLSTKLCSISSFERSLIKSAKGWSNPLGPVYVGPYRLCSLAWNFLSIHSKNRLKQRMKNIPG